MNEADEDVLARALRERLRASESLDPVTHARLAAARASALESTLDPARPSPWAWAGVGGLGVASLLAALLVLRPGTGPSPQADLTRADEAFELMVEDDAALGPEFYEDLDVLHWLAEGDEHA